MQDLDRTPGNIFFNIKYMDVIVKPVIRVIQGKDKSWSLKTDDPLM